MRKRYINILAAFATVLLAAACGSKEQTQPSEPETDALEEMTIEAEVATRTVMNTDNTVDWSVSDAISVFSTSHRVNHSFGSSHSAVSHLTTFSGKIERGTTEVLALYPYTASAAYSGSTVTGMSIPTTQTATESSFANGASVTIAKGSTKGDMKKTTVLLFENLCSVLRFTVPEGIKESSSIRVESIDSNVKMSGAVTIDPATKAITSATAPYVDLSGSFTAGNTYCVTVAPGNYDQGFRFTINGSGGNTLVREAPAVNAEKGKVYTIGALNPALDGNAASISSCSITHSYASSTLTGSDATITLATIVPQDEFASNIKGWKLKNVTMKKDGSVLYRSLPDGTAFTGGQPFSLNQESGKPYMPQGSYTFSADIYYTVNKADGTPADKFLKTVTTTVTSPAPDASKFTLTASPTGYTSYSCYKGTDGQSANTTTANSKDNSTIYSVGAAYAGGLSSDVYNQCSNLLTIISYLDDTAASGDKTKQSWDKHTISARASFDGVSVSTASKDVYVTGLPYRLKHKANEQGSHSWSIYAGKVNWNSDNIDIYTSSPQPIVQSCSFYVPKDNIPIKVTGLIKRDDFGTLRVPDAGVKINGSDEQTQSMGKNSTWNVDISKWTLSDKGWFEVQFHYNASGPHLFIYSFNVDYR